MSLDELFADLAFRHCAGTPDRANALDQVRA